ncbi:carboxypeptidase-like regulatory domain-containing protein [Longimicrobium sp.]|uniref:carboxypeptidase-like regulatory domain-containing protein n=1 Tax=Longimicrobium sp. TaxID=2029185 RepID=UPI003B3A1BBB
MARMNGARRLLGMLLVLAAGLVGSVGTLAAQDARVLGRVTDGVGNPVAQATVTLVGEDGAAAQATTSGPSGGFQFQGVAPGTYTLRAVRDGFEVREQRVTVHAGRVATPLVRLNTAGRTQRGVVAVRMPAR